jgi:hypothetical protein
MYEEFATVLDAFGAFDGLADPERAATIIAVSACAAEDPSARLRELAAVEPDQNVARALTLAADAW